MYLFILLYTSSRELLLILSTCVFSVVYQILSATGVMKLSVVSLVQAIKTHSILKLPGHIGESSIIRVEVHYMITSLCSTWPSLLLRLVIDPAFFTHIAACTFSLTPVLYVETVYPLCHILLHEKCWMGWAMSSPPHCSPSLNNDHFKSLSI